MAGKNRTKKRKINLHVLIFFLFSIVIIPNIYYESATDKHLEPRLFALSGFIFLSVIFMIFGKKNKFKTFDFDILKNPLVIIYFSYLIITGISVFFSINKFEAVYEFLKLFTFFIFFIYVILFIANQEVSKIIFIKSVVVLSLIISFIGLIQFSVILQNSGFGIKSVYEIIGNSSHKNLYSQLLFLTFSFSLYGLWRFKDIWRKLSFAAALINIILIVSIMTRSVWLALIIASILTFGVFIFSGLKKDFTNKKLKPLIISGGIITAFALAMLIFISVSDSKKTINHHIKEGTDFSSGNTYHRINLWKKTFSLIKENPVIGVGAGNWKINIAKKGATIPNKNGWKNAMRPHSDYLWVLSETGIIGFILYFSIFIFSLYFIVKYIRKTSEPDNKIFILIFFFAITGYAVYSFFSFPKERIEHQIFMNIIFAFLVFEYNSFFNKNPEKNKIQNKISIKIISLFALILLLFASVSSYKRIKAEVGFSKIFALQKQGKYNDIISLIDDFYSPVTTLDYAGNPVLFYKALASDKTNMPTKKVINLFHETLQDHPYNIRTFNGLIYIYSKNKNYKEAEKYCKKALRYNSGDAVTGLNYAKIKEKMYGRDSAYVEIRKVKSAKGNKSFNNYLNYLLKNKVNILIEKTDDKKLKTKLLQKVKNKKFLKKIHNKSVNKNKEFEKILLKKLSEN